MNVEGGFNIVAVFDGTTLNGVLRVEGTPLVQRYTKGTNKYIPDFTALAENKKPTVAFILRDVSSGEIMPVQTKTWKYNGVAIDFSSGDVSKDGLFKKIDNYPAPIGDTTVNVPALRVMKNLISLTNYDNDTISIEGTVEINGQSIPFKEISKEVIIQETTGNSFDVVISDNKGSILMQDGESLTCTATVYKDGIEVTDYTGYTFQWVKLLGTGDVNWGPASASRNKVVKTSDIDNILKLRCDVIFGGSVIVSGFTEITDRSDPYFVTFNITGITGDKIRAGQTAVITPVARSRKEGVPDKTGLDWDFSIKNNKGQPFTLTGKGGATFKAKSVNITYADTKSASGGISGSVSATI